MIVLWIIPAILALLAAILLFGRVGIRITYRETLKVVLSACGIRHPLYPEKEPRKRPVRDLSKCRNPDAVLQRELKKQEKALEKAKQRKLEKRAKRKRKKKSETPLPANQVEVTTNLREKLDMILAILKKLYDETHGKLKIHLRRMQITVGAEDAAKTAILYGVILQGASYILNFIEEGFNPIDRKYGDVSVSPDYLSGKCKADIDIRLSVKLWRFIRIVIVMLLSYQKEKDLAYQKAAIRIRKKLRRERMKAKNN